jgi:SAM-dependent methyltransferase
VTPPTPAGAPASASRAGVVVTEEPVCPFGRCRPGVDADLVGSGWDFEYDTTRDEFELVRCRSCALVHLRRLPAAEAMHVIYPSDYYSFSEAATERGIVKWVRDRIEIGKGRTYTALVGDRPATVLDIGCGDGRLLHILRRRCPPTWRYAGIELSEPAAARARAAGFETRSGDFESVEVSDWEQRFDLALMHQVLEHTRHPRRALDKARGLLRPGGILSVETPDVAAWDFRLFQRRYWGGYHIPRHFFLFGKANIGHLAAEAGFAVISCRSILSPVFWVHSLHNALVDHARTQSLARRVRPQNPLLLAIATTIEIVQTRLFGQSSNMQVILRRVD